MLQTVENFTISIEEVRKTTAQTSNRKEGMSGTKDYLLLRCGSRLISNPIWRVADVKVYGAWNRCSNRNSSELWELLIERKVSRSNSVFRSTWFIPRVKSKLRLMLHSLPTPWKAFYVVRPFYAPRRQFSILPIKTRKNNLSSRVKFI